MERKPNTIGIVAASELLKDVIEESLLQHEQRRMKLEAELKSAQSVVGG